ncbi:hypothetical protein V9L05_01375 [Bernardetia sp. Wsw4-3y2]|uniref:hypothetical protein n=1 Tax=Bernardetia sp. Wsw4-3y2 TaxID=3127471 RepID=UPI0030CF783A
MDTQDLTDVDYGSVQAKGIAPIFYIALLSDVLTLPALPVAPTTYAESTTIVGDIAFKVGKCFKQVQARIDQSFLDSETAGETESMSFNTDFGFSIPTNHPSALGFIKHFLNKQVVIVAEELCEGNRLIGGKCNYAYVKSAKIMSGKGQDSFKGIEVVVGISGTFPMRYEGAVPLTPAV